MARQSKHEAALHLYLYTRWQLAVSHPIIILSFRSPLCQVPSRSTMSHFSQSETFSDDDWDEDVDLVSIPGPDASKDDLMKVCATS